MFLLYAATVIFGLVVGSFLNVCIYRVPREKSIVYPASSCPSCGAKIKPWHNIPVLSYLWLGGRCSSCRERISLKYPAVELMNALLYVAALYRFGISGRTLLVMALLSAFIVVTFIDLEHQIIPDGITLPGIVLGLILGPLVFHTGFVNSLLGVAAGGGLFYLIAVISKGGMGGGDIKLVAMIGAFLGWKPVLLTIFIGSTLGAVIGLGLMAFKGMHRKTPIPFGPFLVAGAIVTIFFGNELYNLYGRVSFFS